MDANTNNNAPPTGPAAKTSNAEKIMVSNLPQDVSEAQIKVSLSSIP